MKTKTKQPKLDPIVEWRLTSPNCKGVLRFRKVYTRNGAHTDEKGRYELMGGERRPLFFRVSMQADSNRCLLVMDRINAKPKSVTPKKALEHVASALAWQSYGQGDVKLDNGNLSYLLDRHLGIQ